MSDIGPGDWVEAVRSLTDTNNVDRLMAGAIYCVDAILEDGVACRECGKIRPSALLRTDVDREFGWCLCNFRPIRDASEHVARKTGVKESA